MGEDSFGRYRRLVRNALKALDDLDGLRTLHLTSVAEAIESASDYRRRIIFRPKPQADFEHISPFGITLTQEFLVRFPGTDEEKRLYEHFLYYPVDGVGNNAAVTPVTSFSIAHELCHILMHAPLKGEDDPRVYYPLEAGKRTLYEVSYSAEEEKEADIFAAILWDQRKPPVRPPGFREPCIRSLLELRNLGVFKSGLGSIMPKKSTCFVSTHK